MANRDRSVDSANERSAEGTSVSRRTLLGGAGAAGVAGFAGCLRLFTDDGEGNGNGTSTASKLNPLTEYPNREWESHYRDVWDVDDTYYLACRPNDTHNCYLEANVKNGVVTRLGPSMNYGEAEDLYGNQASDRWDPRVCQKGLSMVERFYGERRVTSPMIRQGFKDWVDEGFPREEDGSMPEEYAKRGEDSWYEASWDEAYEYAAKTFLELADHYSGADAQELLLEQGYDDRVVEEMQGVGTRTMKFRGGMPMLSTIGLFGEYRFANSMALVDHHVRDVGEDEALGGVGGDNYTFHTDLPPGHPMVTGQQTVDFDLANVEYADNIVLAGINWMCTKMADSHWLTEARMNGANVTGIFTDYNATSSKCDELVIIRPATDSALFLGVAQQIIATDGYDAEFVRSNTDLPLLVRMDTGDHLRASDVFEDYDPADLERTQVAPADEHPAPTTVDTADQWITPDQREDWDDFVVYDDAAGGVRAVDREAVGEEFDVDAALEGSWELELADGDIVEVRPVFDLVKEYLDTTWDPESTAEVTGTEPEAVTNLAEQFADNKESTLLLTGMGPNQYFNGDLKDRAAFLVASLTSNVGTHSGNVGSYAGNYRAAMLNGIPHYHLEDPFDPELDPDADSRVDSRITMESMHFYSNLDKPLKIEGEYHMGDSHMNTPTKSLWVAGSNSILGNAKGSYKIIEGLLRTGKLEAFFCNEWWWTMTCEYSDIVFPADSWAEQNVHDLTASVTNPFLMVFPETGIDRVYDTRHDCQIYQGVAEKLAEKLDEPRLEQMWEFIDEDEYRGKPYVQRILDNSNMTKGYDAETLIEKAERGEPALMMSTTYPKKIGTRQANDDEPWYTKTGRLEFLREEETWTEVGETLPVHREAVDGTIYKPNVIVDDGDHPLIDPETPDDLGWDDDNIEDASARQVRNEVVSTDALVNSSHPLQDVDPGFKYSFMTPKYRHGAHTFCNALPNIAVWWGPFGDRDRKDDRKPYFGEGYVEMNPEDAKEEGFEDGDYVWVDADPNDRPYPSANGDPDEYSRALMRVRYQPAMPRGVTRSWHNLNQASHGTTEATPDRTGMAKNEETDYVSLYRRGGHQSMTRSWLRPTILTDEMNRKGLMGQSIGKGFAPDVHCANGAPRESFVKFEKEGDAGEDGEGLWRPAEMGLRPGYETETMQRYLDGDFTSTEGD
ncbi:molybdopterin oxidoreductase [Natrinema pellirubrum DSM 15624]|uniref:Molybdopterin oxidoreductase n=1 Tax=Natrinema pellirubrum (strain DSM 15624 / CIP 106293 / JCM 10476 / NCIMB 786 / 157) TaxID=797303 RepID=L0JQ93_NATP1|nr:molybdopterin-dependent oxidoreductase [Natrinema pellirubrum]AGB33389.1 nitrate reductase alpha subunit [Natrinema pellirubrum DSM 15624]ELY71217.1 molybdopterin oxidoreductase [Natrinema pellirubrum DSM 15624]